MEPLIVLALVGAGVAINAMIQKHRWTEVATRLGLQFNPGFLMSAPEVSGPYEGFWLRLAHRGKEGYRVVVDGRSRIPSVIKLGAENLFTRTMAPDILTGDAHFDSRARILGSEESCLAVLDRQTRVHVMDVVVDGGGTVESGRVMVTKSGLDPAEAAIPGLVELARRVSLGQHELAERLAANATSDPLPAVRLRNLRVLLDSFPDHDQTRQACARAMCSPFPELRLEAAIHLGAVGIDAMSEIALGPDFDEDLRVRAVEGLTRSSWAERTVPILERFLVPGAMGSIRVRRVAIEALGRFRHRPALRRLEVLADSVDVRTAETIAAAMGRIGDSAAEPALVRLLEHRDSRVKAAATRALGRIGTAEAVEPLLELGKGLFSTGLKRTAREAVARIQERLGPGERGGLTVAVPIEHDGALSAVDGVGDEGALSLEGDEADAEGDG